MLELKSDFPPDGGLHVQLVDDQATTGTTGPKVQLQALGLHTKSKIRTWKTRCMAQISTEVRTPSLNLPNLAKRWKGHWHCVLDPKKKSRGNELSTIVTGKNENGNGNGGQDARRNSESATGAKSCKCHLDEQAIFTQKAQCPDWCWCESKDARVWRLFGVNVGKMLLTGAGAIFRDPRRPRNEKQCQLFRAYMSSPKAVAKNVCVFNQPLASTLVYFWRTDSLSTKQNSRNGT